MRIAVWGRAWEDFPEDHDGIEAISERFEVLREGGVDCYFAYVSRAGEHFFESETIGPPSRDRRS